MNLDAGVFSLIFGQQVSCGVSNVSATYKCGALKVAVLCVTKRGFRRRRRRLQNVNSHAVGVYVNAFHLEDVTDIGVTKTKSPAASAKRNFANNSSTFAVKYAVATDTAWATTTGMSEMAPCVPPVAKGQCDVARTVVDGTETRSSGFRQKAADGERKNSRNCCRETYATTQKNSVTVVKVAISMRFM